MGREIRKVPANWQHPTKERYDIRTGRTVEYYQPLYNRPYIEALTEWIKEHEAWERGEHEGQVKYGHTKAEFPHYANYGGNAPDVEYYRPNWPAEEMTWWQVFETVSEGTPVTPPFETREELVEYLVENGDFWDQSRRKEGRSSMPCEPWSRRNAEAFVMGSGWAPSMVIDNGKIMSGVEALSSANVPALAQSGGEKSPTKESNS